VSRSVGRAVAGAGIAVVVYAAAVPWVFRPWFLTPNSLPQVGGSLGAISNADLHLNLWILAWVARAAVLSPAHLFDGNVFHPAAGTITGSENMLAHLPLTVPVLFATGDPLQLLRVVALESFTLAGLAVFLLVRHHTRDDAAALVAGATYTFTPLRVLSAPWPQYFGTQYLPFAMLAIDCWLARRRRRALVGLAAAVALQGLASVYVGAFTAMLLPVYAAVRLRSLPVGERWPAALRLGGALAVGVLLLVPAALPYVLSRRAGVIPAIPAEVLGFGSLLPHVVFDLDWVPWTGAVTPVLALAGVLMTVGRRRLGAPPASRGGPAAAAWAMTAVAVFLAMGPYTYVGDTRIPTPYLLLHFWIPGFSTFRAPIRFLIVCSAALSVLAGYALARAFAGRTAVLRWSVAGALVVLVVVLAAPTPSATTPAGFAQHAAPVYRTLAERPPGEPVAELPAQIAEDDISGMLASARAMTASTIHWQPLVNGYTAYEPLAAPLLRGILLRLPRPEALQALVDVTGARWLVVHRNRLRPEVAQLWPPGPPPAGLELVQRAGADELYAITLPRRHDWTSLVQASTERDGRTFEGTSKAALSPSCRRGRLLNLELPPRIYPLPVAVPARVRFANDGDCTWPGIDVRADGLVVLRHRWHRPDGSVLPWSLPTRLIADVPPGAVVDDLMAIPPANEPLGRWTSEVELTQVGADEPIARAFSETDLVPVGQPAPAARAGTT
jgi:hypothetical protein